MSSISKAEEYRILSDDDENLELEELDTLPSDVNDRGLQVEEETTMKMKTTDDATTESDSREEYLFSVDDFDFTGYKFRQMKLITQHQLLLITRFPKLVVVLYDHPKFTEWIRNMMPSETPKKDNDAMTQGVERLMSEGNHIVNDLAIRIIVKAVQKHCFNFQGNLRSEKIDLSDTEFWKTLVDSALTEFENHAQSTVSHKNSTEMLMEPREKIPSSRIFKTPSKTRKEEKLGVLSDTAHSGSAPSVTTSVRKPCASTGPKMSPIMAEDSPTKANMYSIQKQHETQVLRSVNKTLKPYRYWNQTTSGAVRKRSCRQPRSVWIT